MTKPKLLFLLSNDYGELAYALHFTAGSPFEAVMAAPARLYQANREAQGFRMLPYGSATEVLAIVDREAPDLVLLCSGYLFAINQLFGIDEFAALIGQLRQRGCRLATTDPFLGILSDINPATFSDRHPLGPTFAEHFRQIFAILKDIIHLYIVDPRGLVGAPSACAFNPGAILPPATLAAANRELVRALDLVPEKPRWAFVLSTEDYVAQAGQYGRDDFAANLLDKFRETAAQGRQPILIAPDSCLESIRPAAETIPDLRLLSFFDHETFRALLLEVEFAFYWNILSNSIFNRTINRRPVFFFDRGHLIHALAPMYQRAHRHYYAGVDLPFLDRQIPLDLNRLLAVAQSWDAGMATIVERFRQLPTPEEIVDVLLREPAQPA